MQNSKEFKNIYRANLCHRSSANNVNFAIDFIIDYDQLTDWYLDITTNYYELLKAITTILLSITTHYFPRSNGSNW